MDAQIVAVASALAASTSVISLIREWFKGRVGRNLRVKVGDATLELTTTDPSDAERIIEAFLAQNSPGLEIAATPVEQPDASGQGPVDERE